MNRAESSPVVDGRVSTTHGSYRKLACRGGRPMVASGRDNDPFVSPHVGPYRVVRRLGSGATAVVYEAEDESLGQRIAVKVLHAHVAERPDTVRRFLHEGRALARIRHPHVVQVIALGRDSGRAYLAMELLEGETLGRLLARNGRLEVAQAMDVFLPVCAAVSAAHDAGVLHRDLKPSNIVLSARPGRRIWPKVVDFGLSKVVAGAAGQDLTASGKILGTAPYMAPEHARGMRHASFASDQYALAVVLYQCLTGELPFAGDGLELFEAIMSAPVSPPSARAGRIPRELDHVILRAMQRDPDKRFENVRAFGAALLPFASDPMRAFWAPDFAGTMSAKTESAVASDEISPDVSRDSTHFTATTNAALRPARWGAFAASMAAAALSGALLTRLSLQPPDRARFPTPEAPRAEATPAHADALASETVPLESSAITSTTLLREPSVSVSAAPPLESRAPHHGEPPRAPALQSAAPHAAGAPASPTVRPPASGAPAASIANTEVRFGDNQAPILP